MKMLTQGDNNPYCNRKNTKYIKLHKIMECKRHHKKRKHIFESILTELDHLKKRYYGTIHNEKPIILREQHNLLLDAATTGSVHNVQLQQQLLTTLLGGNVDTALKDEAQQQMAKTMVAHLHLLINTFTNNIQPVTDWTELPNGMLVVKEDLQQGKIVVRTTEYGKVLYTNIRDTLEGMRIPQLLNYNIGI